MNLTGGTYSVRLAGLLTLNSEVGACSGQWARVLQVNGNCWARGLCDHGSVALVSDGERWVVGTPPERVPC